MDIIHIGVTLLFMEKEEQEIKGILKSLIIKTNIEDFFVSILNVAKRLENNYNYNYLGLNDIFIVSGNLEESAFLGRTSFYDYDDLPKAKTLISDDFSFNKNTSSEVFNCSLIYFCESENKEKYTISILSIVNSNVKDVVKKIHLLSENKNFVKKIKQHSIDDIKYVKYIGIEDICDIDLKFNVFQSFYSDFESVEDINKEVLSNEEIEDILGDVFC